jgi:hypothetical protein
VSFGCTLRALEQASVVDGNGSLRGNTRDDPLRSLGENA